MSEPPSDKPGFVQRTLAFIRDPEVAVWRKLVGGIAVLYVILPFDIIWDIFPIIGWLDDLGVVSLVTWYMVRQINKHAEARARLPPPQSLSR